MRLSVILSSLLWCFPGFGDDLPDMGESLVEALSKVERLKITAERLEKVTIRNIQNMTGLEKESIKNSLLIVIPLAAGKISTKSFNTKIGIHDFMYIRPDLEYNFKDGVATFTTGFEWRY